jgi:hypothetical protein
MVEYILVETRPDLMNGEWERLSCAPRPAKAAGCAGKKVPLQKGSDEDVSKLPCQIM